MSSNIFHIENFVFTYATWSIDLGGISRIFSNQRARDRRADRNLALFDVGLIVADDLVFYDLTTASVLKLDRSAKNTAAVGGNLCRINDLCIGQLTFKFGNTSLNETLAFLGGRIFGILR